MKKYGILNGQLSKTIAELGHTDMLVICDAGLPIPVTSNRVDLALKKGIPPFIDTLRAVLQELVIERVILAEEIKVESPVLYQEIRNELDSIPVSFVSHRNFKQLLPEAKGVVRTGEFTPYANIILISGITGLFS